MTMSCRSKGGICRFWSVRRIPLPTHVRCFRDRGSTHASARRITCSRSTARPSPTSLACSRAASTSRQSIQAYFTRRLTDRIVCFPSCRSLSGHDAWRRLRTAGYDAGHVLPRCHVLAPTGDSQHAVSRVRSSSGRWLAASWAERKSQGSPRYGAEARADFHSRQVAQGCHPRRRE